MITATTTNGIKVQIVDTIRDRGMVKAICYAVNCTTFCQYTHGGPVMTARAVIPVIHLHNVCRDGEPVGQAPQITRPRRSRQAGWVRPTWSKPEGLDGICASGAMVQTPASGGYYAEEIELAVMTDQELEY